MKVMFIADQKETFESYHQFFDQFPVETVQYRVFVKAMDNLEEIAPDCIVINAKDFPRQWKTLMEYSRDISGRLGLSLPKVILCTHGSPYFGEDEREKARVLGVKAVVGGLTRPEDAATVQEILDL